VIKKYEKVSPKDHAKEASRPFSARDSIYEGIQQVSTPASGLGSTGAVMSPGQRELALNLMLRNIQAELET
jgi:hypothetical protein